MPGQSNYEKAARLVGWVGRAPSGEETPWVAGFGIEKGHICALLAIADELRELKEHLTGERQRKFDLGAFHRGLSGAGAVVPDLPETVERKPE